VRTFATVEELRLALLEWTELYNREWLIERHGHRSRAEARRAFRDDAGKFAASWGPCLLTTNCPGNP
jgi:hypothetical protein